MVVLSTISVIQGNSLAGYFNFQWGKGGRETEQLHLSLRIHAL